jgi:hypothetical protein
MQTTNQAMQLVKDVQFCNIIAGVIEQWISLVREKLCLTTRDLENCV